MATASNENANEKLFSPVFTGRNVIYSDVDVIDESNVVEVIENKAFIKHLMNRHQIHYLYEYYKGKQPILNRVKERNAFINNKIVENRAKEIVDFKVGYVAGEPIQYISRTSDEKVSKAVALLNGLMLSEGKDIKDRELIEWQKICGTAYRMVLPDSNEMREEDEAPFELYTLDPHQTFCVYSSKIGNKALAGVYYTVTEDMRVIFSVYTDEWYFEISGGKILKQERHTLGMIPIIEYPANTARLGAFEPVISLLDAINTVDSNRIDGIEQFIQSLIVAYNCQFEEGTTANTIKEMGMVVLNSIGDKAADIKILSEQLSQSDTQTVKNDMYNTVLTICAMPNRNGGSSTSDTGVAVMYRDGWSAAETDAKNTELAYKASEMKTLKLVLHICRTFGFADIKMSDIAIKFLRRNYENIQTKAQVLTQMLSNPKIHPKLAFIYSNMFPDVEEAYKMSEEYYAEYEAKEEQKETEERMLPEEEQ